MTAWMLGLRPSGTSSVRYSLSKTVKHPHSSPASNDPPHQPPLGMTAERGTGILPRPVQMLRGRGLTPGLRRRAWTGAGRRTATASGCRVHGCRACGCLVRQRAVRRISDYFLPKLVGRDRGTLPGWCPLFPTSRLQHRVAVSGRWSPQRWRHSPGHKRSLSIRT